MLYGGLQEALIWGLKGSRSCSRGTEPGCWAELGSHSLWKAQGQAKPGLPPRACMCEPVGRVERLEDARQAWAWGRQGVSWCSVLVAAQCTEQQ